MAKLYNKEKVVAMRFEENWVILLQKRDGPIANMACTNKMGKVAFIVQISNKKGIVNPIVKFWKEYSANFTDKKLLFSCFLCYSKRF